MELAADDPAIYHVERDEHGAIIIDEDGYDGAEDRDQASG
jgi:hypothetical protein